MKIEVKLPAYMEGWVEKYYHNQMPYYLRLLWKNGMRQAIIKSLTEYMVEHWSLSERKFNDVMEEWMVLNNIRVTESNMEALKKSYYRSKEEDDLPLFQDDADEVEVSDEPIELNLPGEGQ